jgi:hypothetical protein
MFIRDISIGLRARCVRRLIEQVPFLESHTTYDSRISSAFRRFVRERRVARGESRAHDEQLCAFAGGERTKSKLLFDRERWSRTIVFETHAANEQR